MLQTLAKAHSGSDCILIESSWILNSLNQIGTKIVTASSNDSFLQSVFSLPVGVGCANSHPPSPMASLLGLDTLPDLWVAFHLYLEPAFVEVLHDRVIVFRPKE